MPSQYFEGQKYCCACDRATGNFRLYARDGNEMPVTLKGGDAFLFKKHLELISAVQDSTLAERTERVVEIHYRFFTKTCPMPQFLETQ
jgi:hypothetical protein